MARRIWDMGSAPDTPQTIIVGIVVLVFVVSPVLTIFQVRKHYREKARELSVSEVILPPSGTLLPGYRELEKQEQQYTTLKSDASYRSAIIVGPIAAILFTGVGLHHIC